MRSHAHDGGSIGDLRRGFPAAKLPHAKEFGREGTVAEFRDCFSEGHMDAVLQGGGSAGLEVRLHDIACILDCLHALGASLHSTTKSHINHNVQHHLECPCHCIVPSYCSRSRLLWNVCLQTPLA